MATNSLPPIPPLRGLLEVSKLMRAEADVREILRAVATVISDSLGYRTVVVNLYRPAWDDLCVTAVYGDYALEAQLGQTRGSADWALLLDERSRRQGAYVVLDENAEGEAWQPSDEVLLPMRHTAGHLLGVLAVGDPTSGRRPQDDELDVLVALADHAALAIQSSQESANAARHRVALERLLAVSSSLTAEPATDEILRAVCSGIRDALGFQNVLAALRQRDSSQLDPRAAVGWTLEAVAQRPPVYLDDVAGLIDPAFEIEGCYLVPNEEAVRRIGMGGDPYVSEQNGRGPWAWNNHWLLVPLHDGDGEVIGVLWADEPDDRLLPSRETLQALRVFANQAAAAVMASARLNEVRFLADHDPLTRLLNRRAFVERLDGEVARTLRYGHTFSLVLCDLDGFKALNDKFGHPVGDEALVGFARTLVAGLRKGDEAYRIGGDEFALLLAEASEKDAREVVRRITSQPDAAKASFGVASCPAHGNEAQNLFRLADAALYEAKRTGTGLQFVA